MIVLGPGSLFSSVLPNLLISDVRDALAASPGMKAYVCNVATQPGETQSMSASAHLEALFAHVGEDLIDYVILNRNTDARRPEGWRAEPVEVDVHRLEELPVVIVEEDVIDPHNAHRHEPPSSRLPSCGSSRRIESRGRGRGASAARRPPPPDRRGAPGRRGQGRAGADPAARACDRRAELIGLATDRPATPSAPSTMPPRGPRSTLRARSACRSHRPAQWSRIGRASGRAITSSSSSIGARWSVVMGGGTAVRPSRLPAWRAPRIRLDLVRRKRAARRVRPRRARRGRGAPAAFPRSTCGHCARSAGPARRLPEGPEEIVALLRLVGANRGVLELETHRAGATCGPD